MITYFQYSSYMLAKAVCGAYCRYGRYSELVVKGCPSGLNTDNRS